MVEAASSHALYLVERLRIVQRQRCRVEKSLEDALSALETVEEGSEHRDTAILRSMPGAGSSAVATMLAKAYEAIRDRDYHALRVLSGVAPVTRRSGKAVFVQRRYACNQDLSVAMYRWDRNVVRCDPLLGRRYKEAIERGKRHGCAARLVGDMLLRIACAILRSQKEYDVTIREEWKAA